MAKRLTVAQKQARDLIQKGAVDYAAKRRKEGAEYKDIENELKNAGVTDHNGKPFHNANLSSSVIKSYPELRTRSLKKSQTNQTTSEQTWAVSANALRKLLNK